MTLGLESSGLTNAVFLDPRHLSSDIPHAPNTSHGQLFARNSSLLMDRMRDTRMTPDSSPANMLSSPIDLRFTRASDEQMLGSGESSYIQSQILIDRQRQKINDLENQNRILEMDVVIWRTRFMTAQDTLDKLIQSGQSTTDLASTTLATSRDIPSPLDPKDYRQVRFWTAKSFEAYCDASTGETDGLATQQKRRGRRRKSECNEDRYPYLENADGSPIPQETIVKVGQKARRLWQGMNTAGLAPPSWGKASEKAYKYFNSEMLNEPGFEFFRYCEGNWKIMRWATRAYASWARNHFKSSNAGDSNSKTPRATKRKRDHLDDPHLLQIDDDKTEDSLWPDPIENSCDNSCNILASPASPAPSASIHTQQPVTTLADPLDELYDNVNTSTARSAANLTTNQEPVQGTLSSATVTTTSSSSASAITMSCPPAPTTITSSLSLTTTLATTTSSAPFTATTSEKETHATQDTGMRSVDNNTMVTGVAQSSASTLCGTTPTLASTDNNEPAGRRQGSAKRAKGLAVVGTGLTDKNFCMKDWLQENPDGLKDAFEQYFKALPAEARKTYKDRATAAQKAARIGKKKGTTQPEAQ